jgi:hypothetical protein
LIVTSKENEMNWFEVDKDGLGKLVADRGKIFIIHELLSNAFDEDGVTDIAITLEPVPKALRAVLTIKDNSTNGFRNLTDAWTLFAESYKKADANKRGRFNLGEKLVLALCETATITTTTGHVVFNKDGRWVHRIKTKAGTVFEADIRIIRAEVAEIDREIDKVIVPSGIKVTYNGRELPHRECVLEFETTLPTLLADAEGVLRRSERRTIVKLYQPLVGEVASIYEMGIPVVETGDTFHIDVGQKVPLNADRDNVSPSYLKTLRVEVMNRTSHLMTKERAASVEAQAATSDPRCSVETISTVIDKRFGEKRFIWDPSDKEANNALIARGYTPIMGGSLNAGQWDNVKNGNVAEPAGVLCPTPKYGSGTRPEHLVEKWTPGMEKVAEFMGLLGKELLGGMISCVIVREPKEYCSASYGRRRLTLNLSHLGHKFFDEFPGNIEQVIDLAIHEFGHEYSGNHLSEDYYHALTRLGAKCTMLALRNPKFFPVQSQSLGIGDPVSSGGVNE